MPAVHPVRRAMHFLAIAALCCTAVTAQVVPNNPPPAAQPSFSSAVAKVQAGQNEQALATIDEALKSRPLDPQWRFLKGTALTQAGRSQEAMAVLISLTEDFPNLPEPHNNLAVLQAATGQIVQARLSLEAAIRADPRYALAHENLGDVHLQLAMDSYRSALSAGGNPGSLEKKIGRLRLMLDSTVNALGTETMPSKR